MEQKHILWLYNTDLLTFSMAEYGIEGLEAEIHEINQAERSRSRWTWNPSLPV